MTLADTLSKLEADIAKKNDKDYADTHRFCRGAPVTEAEIAKREKALKVDFPPSYREFLLQHGRFTLGVPDEEHDQLVFTIRELDEHRTALAEFAEQLECKATASAVAEEIGMEPDVVKVLKEMVLVGVEGHEDFVGFDLRTRNKKTGECRFGLVLFDDTEIEALSEEETKPCEGRGFDDWLAEHIQRRSE